MCFSLFAQLWSGGWWRGNLYLRIMSYPPPCNLCLRVLRAVVGSIEAETCRVYIPFQPWNFGWSCRIPLASLLSLVLSIRCLLSISFPSRSILHSFH